MRSHTGQKPYECKACGLGFSKKESLKQHEYTHEKEKKFKCDKCPDDRFFRTPHGLRQHMIFHGEKRYKCLKCEKMFHTSSDLKRHAQIHTNVKSFACQFCDEKFLTIAKTNGHDNRIFYVHTSPKHIFI